MRSQSDVTPLDINYLRSSENIKRNHGIKRNTPMKHETFVFN